MWKLSLGLTLAVVGLVWFTPPASAAPNAFNANLVIYDDEFTDWQTMPVASIQAFLNSKPGVLKSYSINGKTAAEWIYTAAQANRISAKVLLTTLQKEQSLIENPSPSQRALDYAMGYGCPDSGGCSPDTKGFDKQIDFAGWQFRRYIDQINAQGYTVSYWGPGISKNITCISSDESRGLCTAGTTITITPANKATAALYTYTPHPGGNYSFWNLWQRYQFNLLRKYPSGALLRAEGSPHVWLIQAGQKRRFTNSTAFLSRYQFNQVIVVPNDHLLLYEEGHGISYANYSLLASPSGGVYLLVDDTKRPITSRAAFQNAGFRWEEVVKTTWAILDTFPEGEKITTENVYPSGQLLQNKVNGGIWYVQDGVRHPIPCREVYRSQFGQRRAVSVAPSDLERYTFGTSVGFKDGELVTAGGTAYLISQGLKLAIANPETFNAYRFSWANLKRVADACIAVHPDGPGLDITVPVQTASQ